MRLLPELVAPLGNFQAADNNSTDSPDDLNDRILVEQLARSVNLSTSRLRALFRADAGTTPKRKIKQLKLERARQLAVETHLTIDQILAMVAAGDPSHFHREFKKAFGMTLTECRKRCHVEHET